MCSETMRDFFLDPSVCVILTQTRRRGSGSLDLFRLRAGLDRMKKKWKKVQVQFMPRTSGPLLPGENQSFLNSAQSSAQSELKEICSFHLPTSVLLMLNQCTFMADLSF